MDIYIRTILNSPALTLQAIFIALGIAGLIVLIILVRRIDKL